MSDLPQAPVPSGGGSSTAKHIFAGIFRGDVAMALGIIAIIFFMMIPIPAWMLDLGLSISITFSVMILMLVLFIQRPLDLSSFPTILLIATTLRLALNIASTRLILEGGADGTDAAGSVIEAFGTFIIRGDYIIGAIVFGILVIVNFVVVTKGSGRIAEVAARFTLDAMPGKQMAIDSDLSSGLIDEEQAKTRRLELEQESTFFGAMDGAAKFVRGDAVAGLMITFINIVGGIVVGTVTHDMTVGDAAENFVVLTIGDGLVSQIPALIISVGAGLLVSKAGVKGTTDQALLDQFGRYPKAMAMTSALLFTIAVIPAIPFLPFGTLSVVTGAMAWFAFQRQENMKAEAEEMQIEQSQVAPAAEEPISKALAMDTIRLELGYGLLPLVQGETENKITDQVKNLRRQLAEDMGYVLPSVRIQDNLQLGANTYIVRIKEIEAGEGEVRSDMLMCMNPSGGSVDIPGETTVEPTFGLPATWIQESHREEAHFKGYTVVDASTVISTHITEIIKDNMSELLSYAETQKLLDELPPAYQKLVADVIPSQVTVGNLQRILQALLSERVSIRDLPTILEGVAEATAYTRSLTLMGEHVRSRLGRAICSGNVGANGYIPLVTLSPNWEQSFSEALIGEGEDKQLAMPPSQLQEFINGVRAQFEELAQAGETPVLLTSPQIRSHVRSVIERFRPQTVVMSQSEIHPKARIKTVGQI